MDGMDGKEFNFKSLYHATNFPNLKILVDVANEQLKKGISMETVLQESLEFAVSEATSHHVSLVVNANTKVADGLRDLQFYGAWPNLSKAADHALELEEKVLQRDDKLKDITELTALRRKVLKTSISELSKVFKEEWLEENFPLLKQKNELMAEEYQLKKN
jgi:hypothetical protein